MDKFQEDNRILTQKELAALEKEVERNPSRVGLVFGYELIE
jgi:hypothetical protein